MAAVCVVVLAAVLLVATLLASVSRQASVLTSPVNALAAVAATWTVLLLVLYPMWPGTLLGEGDPVERFGRWLLLRAAEVLLLAFVASPVLLAAAIFAGQPLLRVAQVFLGLAGAGLAAIAYRLAYRACDAPWQGAALMDVMLFLFGPLVLGYLVLENSGSSIGWAWLISPLALARAVSFEGLTFADASFWVGLVGYSAVSVPALVLLRWLAARHRRQSQPHSRDTII
ncbi:MAG: hypothetical protein JXL80_16890 [Planctomycetes bacterium]|nr:hypothetical protein [Planctomycetota bacterium]